QSPYALLPLGRTFGINQLAYPDFILGPFILSWLLKRIGGTGRKPPCRKTRIPCGLRLLRPGVPAVSNPFVPSTDGPAHVLDALVGRYAQRRPAAHELSLPSQQLSGVSRSRRRPV